MSCVSRSRCNDYMDHGRVNACYSLQEAGIGGILDCGVRMPPFSEPKRSGLATARIVLLALPPAVARDRAPQTAPKAEHLVPSQPRTSRSDCGATSISYSRDREFQLFSYPRT